MKWRLMACVLVGLMASPALADIANGQVDDFEDGTVMGWSEGTGSPNQPVNVANGGPSGTGDNYLENFSAGGGGPGSRQVMYNRDQWTGDYLDAGVTSIEADLANFGNVSLYVRIALEGAAGEQYASSNFFFLPADGMWYDAVFGLSAADLTQVGGTDPLNTVLGGVGELRILSAESAPAWRGDAISATLGVDNITAVPEPASIMLIGLGGLLMRRR